MPKPEKLYTFADLREVVPLSESKLRQVLAELGMGCGKGCGRGGMGYDRCGGTGCGMGGTGGGLLGTKYQVDCNVRGGVS